MSDAQPGWPPPPPPPSGGWAPPPPAGPGGPGPGNRGWWGRLSGGKKAALIVGALVVLGTIGALFGSDDEPTPVSTASDTTDRRDDTDDADDTRSAVKPTQASELDVGDCFQEPATVSGLTTTVPGASTPDAERVLSVPTVKCDEPHDFEVTIIHKADGADDAYPGSAAIANASTSPCAAGFEDYVGASPQESALDSTPLLFPTKLSWEDGQRDVVCVAVSDDESQVVGSVRGQGRSALVDTFDLVEGDCFQQRAEGATKVTRLACARPHDNEVTGFHELVGDQYPGRAGMAEAAEGPCEAVFASYVGAPSDESSLQSAALYFPTEEGWATGDRRVLCAAYDDDLARVEGSARGQGPS
jgi:hypothetical protein